MRANFGEHFKLTIFGESHGPAIGVVVDGLPAGARLDEDYIAGQMARREKRRTRCASSPAR